MYIDNVVRSIAIETIHKHCKHSSREQILFVLQNIIQSPDEYQTDEVWGKLASVLSPQKRETSFHELLEAPLPHRIFGSENIDELAKHQMEVAMRLPVTIAGALMPDGCAGYGLPIGGVLATTDDVVIPFAVGKDIACRMCLTVLDAGGEYLDKYHTRAIDALINNTAFGFDATLPFKLYHELFDKSEFREISILKKNREKVFDNWEAAEKATILSTYVKLKSLRTIRWDLPKEDTLPFSVILVAQGLVLPSLITIHPLPRKLANYHDKQGHLHG